MIALYTDGGVIGGNPSDIGGTWAWCAVDGDGQRVAEHSGVVLPTDCGGLVTNNVTELVALVEGLEFLPYRWAGTVYSDSWCSLLRVFQAARLQGVPMWLADRLHAIQRSGKLAQMQHTLLDGHPTRAQLAAGVGKRGKPVSIHNVYVDAACNRAKIAHIQTLQEAEVLV